MIFKKKIPLENTQYIDIHSTTYKEVVQDKIHVHKLFNTINVYRIFQFNYMLDP